MIEKNSTTQRNAMRRNYCDSCKLTRTEVKQSKAKKKLVAKSYRSNVMKNDAINEIYSYLEC